ncbi:NAD-dependent epimerase/dehydratase family protein [Glutamicibacter sp. 287]|uniref:NAD-dependent epimerase/dehydratase family protein n=1 Tax=unclassified Glutamicibacter TaxID=2627139 RepID=UPI000BB892D3|nr:NAD-dependent epimerase/dehydratase family protein [Glutamicibacter sp. BW80]PCC27695.1 nucleoside-diphosphate sugar epimerase [Glutamicibacter sp. BW80]
MSEKQSSAPTRRVLVTGASGMLGGAVAELLRTQGHHVRTFQRRPSQGATDDVLGSLTDSEAVGQATEGMDAVIHLAAKVSFTGAWQEFVDTNINGTNNLLRASKEAGIKDFVFVSSPSVAHFGEPLAGATAGAADPERARGNYARSKAAAELNALAQDSDGFRVAAIRPHVVWGPGDTQLVERVIQRAKAGRLPLLDHGAALIDTTYIDNAATAIVRGLERMEFAHGRALVVTNGEPRPVGELIAGICQAGGAPAPRLNVPGWLARGAGSVIERLWLAAGAKNLVHDEPPMTRFLAEQLSTAHWFDQRETHEILDWKPEVTITEGLQRLASHYVELDR